MLFILDANHLVHQFFHVAASNARRDFGPDAKPDISGVLEWVLVRADYLRDFAQQTALSMQAKGVDPGPITLIAVFDASNGSYRKTVMPLYKANRTSDPLVFAAVRAAEEALTGSDEWISMRSPVGYEADDLIASIADQVEDRVLIHSRDKDLNQCLFPGKVSIIKNSRVVDGEPNDHGIPIGSKLEAEIYKASDFSTEFGFPIARWVDYQAMVGDAADNIPGADGIGPKKAMEILQRWPSEPLEAVPYAQMCTERILNKRQAAGWPEFIERLPQLRSVLTLFTNLHFKLEISACPS